MCLGTLKSPTPLSRKAASRERKIASARSWASSGPGGGREFRRRMTSAACRASASKRPSTLSSIPYSVKSTGRRAAATISPESRSIKAQLAERRKRLNMLLPYSCGGSPAVRQASAAPQSQTEGLCAASAKQYHWPKSSVLWNGVLRVRRGHHFLLIPKKLPLVAAAALFLSGCLGYDGQVIHGYQLDPKSAEQVKAGDSAEHILVLLGSPTTTSTVGGDAWYYMTQITNRGLQFMQPKVTDQRVFAVYFTK